MRKCLIVPLVLVGSILLSACPGGGPFDDINPPTDVGSKGFININTYTYEDENGVMQKEIDTNILVFFIDWGQWCVRYENLFGFFLFDYTYSTPNGTIYLMKDTYGVYSDTCLFTYDSIDTTLVLYMKDGNSMEFEYYKVSDAMLEDYEPLYRCSK